MRSVVSSFWRSCGRTQPPASGRGREGEWGRGDDKAGDRREAGDRGCRGRGPSLSEDPRPEELEEPWGAPASRRNIPDATPQLLTPILSLYRDDFPARWSIFRYQPTLTFWEGFVQVGVRCLM